MLAGIHVGLDRAKPQHVESLLRLVHGPSAKPVDAPQHLGTVEFLHLSIDEQHPWRSPDVFKRARRHLQPWQKLSHVADLLTVVTDGEH